MVAGSPRYDHLQRAIRTIGRSQAEIAEYVRQWNAGDAFGEVKGYPGARLPAPELPAAMRLKS